MAIAPDTPGSLPPALAPRRERVLTLPRLLLVALSMFACLVIIIACARRIALARYDGRLAAEMKLLIADGGSANIADLLPQRSSGADGTPPHVLKADDFVFTEAGLPNSGFARIDVDDDKLPRAQKIARAVDGFYSWRGIDDAPVSGAGKAARGPVRDSRMPGAWSDDWLPFLDEYLADNGAPLERAKHEAFSASGFFDHDWQAGPPVTAPELACLQKAAQLIGMEAVIKAHRGDMRGAMEEIRLGLRLRRLINNDPLIASKVVCFQLDRIALSSLKGVLAIGRPDRQAAEPVLNELDGREGMNDLTRQILGATAMGLEAFDKVRADSARYWRLRGTSGSSDPVFFDILWIYTADKANYLARMRDARRFAARGFTAATSMSVPVSAAARRREVDIPFNILADVLSPSLYEEMSGSALADTRVAMGRTALALSLYRSEHDAYPASLDALVPQYLPRLQMDAFCGKPLTYKVRDKGYLLYGVGDDGRDDGGVFGRDYLWETEE